MNFSLRKTLFMGALCAGIPAGLCGPLAMNANADWGAHWHATRVNYARLQAWPQPFNQADARQTVEQFEVMKANGWRLHNTLGNELFRDSDAALVAAGQNRLHWIVSQAPAERRIIYVLRGRSVQETEARMASVRQSIAAMNYAGAPPQIVLTDIEPDTSSGAWATRVNRDWMEALPAPKLPGTSATGSAGATGGN